mgnify:FL=1
MWHVTRAVTWNVAAFPACVLCGRPSRSIGHVGPQAESICRSGVHRPPRDCPRHPTCHPGPRRERTAWNARLAAVPKRRISVPAVVGRLVNHPPGPLPGIRLRFDYHPPKRGRVVSGQRLNKRQADRWSPHRSTRCTTSFYRLGGAVSLIQLHSNPTQRTPHLFCRN